MTDQLRAIDDATARQLMTTLSRLAWPSTRAEMHDLLKDLGWTIDYENPTGGAVATAPYGVKGKNVNIGIRDGAVESFLIRVTDTQTKKSPESLQFMHDAFNRLVALGKELFGPPAHRIAGQNPEVQWRVGEAALTVQNAKVATVINWTSNDFQDRWNEMAAH